MVLNLDIEKAFDTANWEFLDVLQATIFGSKWRKWIRGCTSSANYSILTNGRPRGKIIHSHSIRQVDPISPFLFILVYDCLSQLLSHNARFGLTPTNPIGTSSFYLNH